MDARSLSARRKTSAPAERLTPVTCDRVAARRMPHAYVPGSDDTNEPSQYASSDTLRRRTQRPGGDLSEPATLRAAVQDRTFRGEIILFAFNFCSISDALALMATLRRASFEHFMPFTDGRETCLAMQDLAAVGGGLRHATGTQQPNHPSYSYRMATGC